MYKTVLIAGFILQGLCACCQGYKTQLTVSPDGTGDFTHIQEAINATKAFPDQPVTIYIKNGTYHEKVKVPAWNTHLSFIGESKDKTIITYGDYFDKIGQGRNSTFMTYTLQVDADDFYAENLTIENSAGPVGQAVALHVEGDRCTFVNCAFLGHQDTLYVAGEGSRQYFTRCYIAGTTDFIFGAATAVFEDCTIHARSDSYLTAASTPQGIAYGFVFIRCALTAAEGVSNVYLGRPWRTYARTVFLNCTMGSHIRAEGWHNWHNPDAEKKSFYAEYQSAGPGANTSERVPWSHTLSRKEAARYTLSRIFGDWTPVVASR